MTRDDFNRAVTVKEDLDFANHIFEIFDEKEDTLTSGILVALFEVKENYTEDQVKEAEKCIELIQSALDVYLDNLCDNFESFFDDEDSKEEDTTGYY